MSDPLLSFREVTFGYTAENPEVLDRLSLDFPAGTRTAILGPNGAGKTTLLHLALGWLRPQAGQVLLAGKPLTGYPRRELGQKMGLVPQSEHIPYAYSLLEYVLLGRSPHLPPLAMPTDTDCRIAADALLRVGLGELQHRSILNLSGGERQLVLVARALAQEPSLLLLDEPTSHLDLSNKARLVTLLRELVAQGVSVIFTTHEPDVAAAFATHLVLVQKGRVLRAGTLEEVLTGEALTELYRTPVRVLEVEGRRVVLWDGRQS